MALTPLPFVGGLTGKLTYLESLFTEAHRRRVALWPTNWRDFESDDYWKAERLVEQRRLHDVLKAEAYKTADQVDAEFTKLIAAADTHLATVRRMESLTQPYSAYITELTALAPLVQVMSESVLVSRLRSAITDQRIPQARALLDLATAKYGEGVTVTTGEGTYAVPAGIGAELQRLIMRASDLVVPADEANALQFQADLLGGYRNYKMTRHSLLERVMESLYDRDNGQKPQEHPNYYSPSFLFSGSKYFNF